MHPHLLHIGDTTRTPTQPVRGGLTAHTDTHAECEPTPPALRKTNPLQTTTLCPLRKLPTPATPTATRHRHATPSQDSYVASPRTAFSLVALANVLLVCRRAATCLQKQQTVATKNGPVGLGAQCTKTNMYRTNSQIPVTQLTLTSPRSLVVCPIIKFVLCIRVNKRLRSNPPLGLKPETPLQWTSTCTHHPVPGCGQQPLGFFHQAPLTKQTKQTTKQEEISRQVRK